MKDDPVATIPTLLTHSGKFHCDDALAYATLRLALGLHAAGHDHRLVRTRDKDKIAAADIVFDVGGVHDDATSRFDHHQRGAPVRADDALKRRVARVQARFAAEAIVLEAHARSADPRILELDRGMPWQEPVFSHGLGVLYAVYPVPSGNWMIGAMPPERDSFAQRLPLPAAWAGLQDEALMAASGIGDAVFVHAKRFVASARSRAGAMAMAKASIQLSEAEPTDEIAASASGADGVPAQQPVSLIITQAQRAVLRERGHSDEAIRTMTPAEAHGHLGMVPSS